MLLPPTTCTRRATAVAAQAVGGVPGGAVGWETAVLAQAVGGVPGGAVGWVTAVLAQAVGGVPGGGAAHNLLFVAGEWGVGDFAPRFPALDAHSGGVAEAGGVTAVDHAD